MITKKIYPWLYSIHDPLGVYSFLVVGKTGALLYDTGFGVWPIVDDVRKITDLPLTVVLGHGHVDHANGAFDFDEVWIHPEDYELCLRHTSRTMRRGIIGDITVEGHSPPPEFDESVYVESGSYSKREVFKHLSDNQLFALGGISVQVVPMEGHTAGSVGILVPEHKTLLTSDASNNHIWMFLNESLPIKSYIAMLKRVRDLNFDTFFIGHSDEPKPKSDFDSFIRVATNIDVAKATPYPKMTELSGFIYSEGEFSIVFRKNRL